MNVMYVRGSIREREGWDGGIGGMYIYTRRG